MSFFQYLSVMALLSVHMMSPLQAEDHRLTLRQAVHLSITREEPGILARTAQAETVRATALSQSSLPDPKIKLGLANLPYHDFNFNHDPMTQIKLGLHQDIPSRTRRRLIREKGLETSRIFTHQATEQQLLIIREVRHLWLELLFTTHAEKLLLEKQEKLEELARSLEEKYQSGQSNAQNILLLDAEMAQLDDRQLQLTQNKNITRLKLARYIGERAMTSVPTGAYTQLGIPPALSGLEDNLPNHPALRQHNARIRAESKTIGLAQEDYKPNWGFDIGYGFRSGGRSDLLTAMVTFDMPLFTGNRQDKKLYAARKSKQAAELTRRAREQDMHRNLKVAYIKWQRLSKRLVLHETRILPKTLAAVRATEDSYARGNSRYEDMTRIFLGTLDLRLKIEELKMMRAQTMADLAYFNGDIPKGLTGEIQ